jgi:hypothetical protein
LIPLQTEDIEPIDSKACTSASLAEKFRSGSTASATARSPLHISSTDANGVAGGGDDTYDDFDDTAMTPAVVAAPDVGYDDFDSGPTSRISESATERESANYDAFDTSGDDAGAGAVIGASDEKGEDVRPSEQYDAFEMPVEKSAEDAAVEANQDGFPAPYGYFEDDVGLGDLPDALPLTSTPSAIRMRRNSRFEAVNFTEIVSYMTKYNHYNPSAMTELSNEEMNGLSTAAVVIPSADDIKQRQAYIDAQVSELYSESAATVVPFSSDEVQSRMRESRRLRFDQAPAVSCQVDEAVAGQGLLASCDRPCPLSPDALTAFSNFDPAAVDRNREVIRATERLVKEVVPALARSLADMSEKAVHDLDVSVFFHYHGVNIRHIGLVRSNIPASKTTTLIRTKLLKQIIARTLKNICRDFQRRWMRSEQSSSDQGMFLLLTQFLNLVVGCHDNSEKFWEERVCVGIMQRYGKCALDGNEAHMHRIRKEPLFLKVF